MNRFFIAICLCFTYLMACKSTTKQQADSLYSRHLQQKIDLQIISTTIPDKKNEMNLLFFNNINLLDDLKAKKIIDSLFKSKQIQPIILVAFTASNSNNGLEEIDGTEGKQYKKLNDFVADELYMYVKKKTAIRKFNSVGIYGKDKAAIGAYDIGWNNDEKIQMVGMQDPNFKLSATLTYSSVLKTIELSRKRPTLKIWLATNTLDSNSMRFTTMLNTKLKREATTLLTSNNSFANFLIWAFPASR